MLLEFVTQQATHLREEARPREQLALPLKCPQNIDLHLAAAFTDVCLALFNSSEFIYID